MISGRSSETTYEQTENLNPGKTSSVTAAPPSTCRRSSTRTFFPARARYAAWVRPLCPPPITIALYVLAIAFSSEHQAMSREQSDFAHTHRSLRINCLKQE